MLRYPTIEKKFLHWGHDITSENNPYEAGLSFAVNLKKKEISLEGRY